jgi:hypothetical protein
MASNKPPNWRGDFDPTILDEYNRTGKSRPVQSVDPGFLNWISRLFGMVGGGGAKGAPEGGMTDALDEKRKEEERIRRELGL